MSNLEFMKILHSRNQLFKILTSLLFIYLASPKQMIKELTLLSKLCHQEEVFFSFDDLISDELT